jgi:hypothetical protein
VCQRHTGKEILYQNVNLDTYKLTVLNSTCTSCSRLSCDNQKEDTTKKEYIKEVFVPET